jgi:undecaprenyl-diphosphatase
MMMANPRTLLTMAKREIAPLGALLAIGLALLAFIEIADEVDEGEARWFDEGVLLALRTSDPADPIGPRWLEEIVVEWTALGGFGVLALVTLLVLGYLAMQRKWGGALLVLVATLGGRG